MALCTPTDNSFIPHFFLKKHLHEKLFQKFFFSYIIIHVYTHWWMIPNESNFFKEIKIQWKKSSLQSIIFLFLGPSSVLPLTAMSVEKIFSSKAIHKSFFEIEVSITFVIYLCPIDPLLQTFQNFFKENSFL